MKIGFHGAARTVTGSKHLLTLKDGRRILLDCGMFQGMGRQTDSLNREWGFEPSEVNFLVLTHAHIDHSGLIPKLVADGFRGRIFCTPPTKELCAVMLSDSAGIQEDDAKFINKKRASNGQPYVKPLYTTEDAERCMEFFEIVDYGQWFRVDTGIELLYTDVGHIMGSAAAHLRIVENGNTQQVSFSGDVGRYRDVLLKSPQVFPQADYILIESTYGNSLHDEHLTTPDLILQWIQRACIEKKGKLILPAFSVGRTQEILYTMNQLELENRLPALDYFVDSPLSVDATEIMKRYPQYFNRTIQKVLESDSDPFSFRGLRYIHSVDESKLLNYRNEPCVIVSASGMAEGGRVKHHISNSIENSRNTIVFTGYAEPNSLGGRLMAGATEVSIFGVNHEVHAEIGSIRSMSAHGDYEDLSQFLASQDPRQVKKLYLVHGEYPVQEEFKARLLKKGFYDVMIPQRHYEEGLPG